MSDGMVFIHVDKIKGKLRFIIIIVFTFPSYIIIHHSYGLYFS